MEDIKPYLNEDEVKRAKSCTYNIQDNLNAICKELNDSEHSYKSYLSEKLEQIKWDINFLINMCK